MGAIAVIAAFQSEPTDAKQKLARHAPPELRIVDVTLSPVPYSPSAGPLDLSVKVELPVDLDGATLLEVSSLISSPSKRSMRFLADRQPVEIPSPSVNSISSEGKPRVSVTLTWDGTDQARRLVDGGRYTYEVRAKLLTVGEKGPRTQMVSWPKRGVVEVK
jgi:hypothetical protein